MDTEEPAKAPHGTARVTGHILKIVTEKGTTATYRWYRVKGMPGTPWNLRLIKLEKDGLDTRTIYDIEWRHGAWHCDCPDAIRRREAHGQSCKHVLAAKATKLLPKGGRA